MIIRLFLEKLSIFSLEKADFDNEGYFVSCKLRQTYPPVKMRTVSWLFLFLSFALGIGCAFIVRHYMFEAKPVQMAEQCSTIKILIAKKNIPRGAEITAEAVVFVDVPITKLPSEATMSFAQIDRRRTAFPIPAGYPICNDLLLPYTEDKPETEKFIPPGSQIVSLEINQISLHDEIIEQPFPIADILSADQCIDIRLLPKENIQGELAERKNQLLKTFLSKDEMLEKGEKLLEDVKIYQIQSKPALDGKQIQTLTLFLEKEDAKKLIAATRKSRLRIVPHYTEPLDKPVEENSVAKTAVSAISIEPLVEPIPEPVVTESVALPVAPIPEWIIQEPAAPLDLVAPISEPVFVDSAVSVAEIIDQPQALEEQPSIESIKPRAKLKFVPVQIPAIISDDIRNDEITDRFIPSPQFITEKIDNIPVAEPQTDFQMSVNRSHPLFKVIEIGLPTVNNKSSNTEFSTGYSPWGRRPAVIDSEPEENEIPVQPRLLRGKNVSQR